MCPPADVPECTIDHRGKFTRISNSFPKMSSHTPTVSRAGLTANPISVDVRKCARVNFCASKHPRVVCPPLRISPTGTLSRSAQSTEAWLTSRACNYPNPWQNTAAAEVAEHENYCSQFSALWNGRSFTCVRVYIYIHTRVPNELHEQVHRVRRRARASSPRARNYPLFIQYKSGMSLPPLKCTRLRLWQRSCKVRSRSVT